MNVASAVKFAAVRQASPFLRLWTASSLSNLGDGLYQFALPLLAVDLTRSPSLVSGVTLMLTLAWPIFGLHAGSVVDRFDRRSVLLLVGAIRVATLGLLTVAIVSGGLSLPILYVAALVLGIGETLADTALTALVLSTVAPDRLDWANGRITAGQTITNTFLGPPLAGSLLAVSAGLVTGAATSLYGLAAASLATLPRRQQTAATPGATAAWGVTDGLRFLWRHPLLRRLTLFTAAMNVWWAAFYALFVLFAVAPGPLGLTPPVYGTLIVAMSIGGICGSLGAGRISRLIGTRNALLIDLVGTILLVGMPAVTSNPWLVAVSNVGAGAGTGIWVVLVSSIRQRLTPDELLGRVYSASRLISWGVLPVAAAASGIAAELLGIRTVYAIGAVVSIGLVVAFLVSVPAGELDRAQERQGSMQAGHTPGGE
jgi:MFS family permease